MHTVQYLSVDCGGKWVFHIRVNGGLQAVIITGVWGNLGHFPGAGKDFEWMLINFVILCLHLFQALFSLLSSWKSDTSISSTCYFQHMPFFFLPLYWLRQCLPHVLLGLCQHGRRTEVFLMDGWMSCMNMTFLRKQVRVLTLLLKRSADEKSSSVLGQSLWHQWGGACFPQLARSQEFRSGKLSKENMNVWTTTWGLHSYFSMCSQSKWPWKQNMVREFKYNVFLCTLSNLWTFLNSHTM